MSDSGSDTAGARASGTIGAGSETGAEAEAEAGAEAGEATDDAVATAVIGGGVAGLVAARELALGGARVLLFEGADAVGGRIRSVDLAGAPFDVGAEAFATRGGVVTGLLSELGLAGRIVRPAPAGAWVVSGAGALPLPPGGALGIPARPMRRDVRAHLGLRGALRAACEPLLPRERHPANTTTVAALVGRRAGARVLERLVRPIALGVYSTEPERLPLSAVPGLRAAYAQTGSLVRAARELRDTTLAAGGAVASLSGGMTALIEALSVDLERLGVTVHTGADVAALEAVGPAGSGWILRDSAGGVLTRCAAAILAVPETAAWRLLRPHAPVSADPPEEHTIEIITLAVADERLDAAPRGTGALVPPGAGIAAKALTHVTAKWPDRAAQVDPGLHVLRLSYGRAGHLPETEGLDDASALELVCGDAARVLGCSIDRQLVRDWTRQRWRVGAPPGAEPRITAPPGIALAGDWVSGTGLASVIPGARAAAAALLGSGLPARPIRTHDSSSTQTESPVSPA